MYNTIHVYIYPKKKACRESKYPSIPVTVYSYLEINMTFSVDDVIDFDIVMPYMFVFVYSFYGGFARLGVNWVPVVFHWCRLGTEDQFSLGVTVGSLGCVSMSILFIDIVRAL